MRELVGIALIALVVIGCLVAYWQMQRVRKRRRKEAYWP